MFSPVTDPSLAQKDPTKTTFSIVPCPGSVGTLFWHVESVRCSAQADDGDTAQDCSVKVLHGGIIPMTKTDEHHDGVCAVERSRMAEAGTVVGIDGAILCQ